ncbi:hypothetical protein N499_0613A, partial [Wolbachia pipientis wVitA]
MFKKFT